VVGPGGGPAPPRTAPLHALHGKHMTSQWQTRERQTVYTYVFTPRDVPMADCAIKPCMANTPSRSCHAWQTVQTVHGKHPTSFPYHTGQTVHGKHSILLSTKCCMNRIETPFLFITKTIAAPCRAHTDTQPHEQTNVSLFHLSSAVRIDDA
jgi:hypothetical protein